MSIIDTALMGRASYAGRPAAEKAAKESSEKEVEDSFLKRGDSPGLKEWTILAYMNGNDKAIEGDVVHAFLLTEQVCDPEKYTIAAQLGRAPQSLVHPGSSPDFCDRIDGDWEGVRRYYLSPGTPDPYGSTVSTSMGTHDNKVDSKLIQDLGSLDMSDPKVLRDFLKWGIRTYPAKHYAIVLAGHGNGFLGTQGDYHSRSKDMSLPDLQQVFQEVQKQTGVKPDVLVMDACLMAHSEAAYELRDAAGLMVASENLNYNCLPYQDFLEKINSRMEKGEIITPGIFADSMVSAAEEHGSDIPTISTMKLEHAGELKKGIKSLADALLATECDTAIIRGALDRSHRFIDEKRNTKPLSDYRDLYSLAECLQQEKKLEDPKIKSAALSLMDFIQKRMVGAEYHTQSASADRSIHGLTIYMPVDGFPKENDYGKVIDTWEAKEIKPAYLSLELTRETGWDRVIEKFAGPPRPLPPSEQWF
jgi:hypothetical protein